MTCLVVPGFTGIYFMASSNSLNRYNALNQMKELILGLRLYKQQGSAQTTVLSAL